MYHWDVADGCKGHMQSSQRLLVQNQEEAGLNMHAKRRAYGNKARIKREKEKTKFESASQTAVLIYPANNIPQNGNFIAKILCVLKVEVLFQHDLDGHFCAPPYATKYFSKGSWSEPTKTSRHMPHPQPLGFWNHKLNTIWFCHMNQGESRNRGRLLIFIKGTVHLKIKKWHTNWTK